MGDELPALSDQRLIVLQKQSRRMRKSITILNDKLKTKQQRVERMVEKNKASDQFRRWQHTMPYKNSLAEIRGLQKCLKKRRESSTLDPEFTPRNGVYDGETLDSMKGEVHSLIQERNPRERRLRKVERFKNNGYRDGRIVDYDTSMAKFSEMISRPKCLYRDETHLQVKYSRPSSAFDLLRNRGTTPETPSTSCDEAAEPPDSPPRFRLPPIQARRSTIANTSLVSRVTKRMFDVKSDGDVSVRSSLKQRSMSFAISWDKMNSNWTLSVVMLNISNCDWTESLCQGRFFERCLFNSRFVANSSFANFQEV